MNASKKVLLGFSGGVDSSVCAQLLQEQGYEVTGLFLKTWDDEHCTSQRDSFDARMVADKLNISLYTLDLSQEYNDFVFQYFLDQNRAGRTPNPDILCNKYIKFSAFLKKADELSIPFIATGHYAHNYWNESQKKQELLIPKDTHKDQTYFLYTLNQNILARTIFPLAHLTKSEVRQKAQLLTFPNADKKDSVGICMVGDRNYKSFIQQYISKNEGPIRDIRTQKTIGSHEGLSFYTIGQRRDLGIGGVKGCEEKPWFVVRKEKTQNTLWVSQYEDDLLFSELTAHSLHWVSGNAPDTTKTYTAKIRYRSEGSPCEIRIENDTLHIRFHSPVRAVAIGQSVVLYEGNKCLGGGEIIEST